MGQGGDYLRSGTGAHVSTAEKPSSLVSFRAGAAPVTTRGAGQAGD